MATSIARRSAWLAAGLWLASGLVCGCQATPAGVTPIQPPFPSPKATVGGVSLPAVQAPAASPESRASNVDGWAGSILPLCAMAQFDDFFRRSDGQEYGITGASQEVEALIEEARCQSRAVVKVWGRLESQAMDHGAAQIVAERVVIVEVHAPPLAERGPGQEPVVAWQGRVHPFCRSRGADNYFEREDGMRYGIAAESEALREALHRAECEGYPVRVWGTLHKGVEDYRGTRIVLERLERAS